MSVCLSVQMWSDFNCTITNSATVIKVNILESVSKQNLKGLFHKKATVDRVLLSVKLKT